MAARTRTHWATDTPLAAKLRHELQGEVLFDAPSRGRYSTDASFYQIVPIGVVIPRTTDDARIAITIAHEHGIPVLPRGGGTSQCGQAIGHALVIDTTKYLTNIVDFDPAARTVTVEPGVVLDRLNRFLKPHGLVFPVDISTATRATIGGMAGNNSVGARSLRYGQMVDHVLGIDAVLADGETLRFASEADGRGVAPKLAQLAAHLKALHAREAEEIARRFPKVKRNVAGYNLDRLGRDPLNLAELLVGSEGTLAWFSGIELALSAIPAHKVLGVCHFPSFRGAMEAVQHIVTLEPTAVELMDRSVLELARESAAFRPVIERFVRGTPEALLLVEFAGDVEHTELGKLDALGALLGDLGYPDSVVRAVEPSAQQTLWNVRSAALNIVMSMKGDGKPVSFIEDCAVPLDKLGEYTTRLEQVFRKHGTSGTWYAHASVGCLHVRPILNLKDPADVAKLRRIAEEAHAFVREYKGTHSGEHGDGLVRSEFLEPMLGARLVRAFEEVKRCFDPEGRMNPGKIVWPSRMDDRSLFRFKPGHAPLPLEHGLDWSEWGGFHRAVEMCNNNGACRKRDAGVMCPSYRVTLDEKHVTRGRANTLRLALTGQLAPDALTSKDMYEVMDLCVGCKGCKRECPTGVDMYRMKIEFLNHYRKRWGLSLQDRLIAYLPRYAPWAARVPWLANLPDRTKLGTRLREPLLGFAARRPLPRWRRDVYRGNGGESGGGDREVVLLVDTFTRYFEPETAHSAELLLTAAGYRVLSPAPTDGKRPLCCGRTFLNTGLIDQARQEAQRLVHTLGPLAERGVPIVGLEPSCLLTLRDELLALMPRAAVGALPERAMMLQEFLVREHEQGRLRIELGSLPESRALVHGHCHQKAFGLMSSVQQVLSWIPGLQVEVIQSSCCGMAGSFGYGANHYDLSMRMAELSLLPAVRAAPDALIVADGTSCRRQIEDGAGRRGWHSAQVLARALSSG